MLLVYKAYIFTYTSDAYINYLHIHKNTYKGYSKYIDTYN